MWSKTRSVKANSGGEQVLLRRVVEDQSGQAAGVGTKGYGVKDGEDGFEEANHAVVRGRADDGGVALPLCFEQGYDVRGGRHDGNGRLGGDFFLIFNNNHI